MLPIISVLFIDSISTMLIITFLGNNSMVRDQTLHICKVCGLRDYPRILSKIGRTSSLLSSLTVHYSYKLKFFVEGINCGMATHFATASFWLRSTQGSRHRRSKCTECVAGACHKCNSSVRALIGLALFITK